MPKSKYSTGLEGQRFGRWTVIRLSHTRTEPRRDAKTARTIYYWLCRCDCGNEKAVDARTLVRGHSTSCGCYNSEVRSAIFSRPGFNRMGALKHGHLIGVKSGNLRRSTEYSSWLHAKDRVSNPNNERWHRYGGRGIAACEGFRDFPVFLRVIGHKPTAKHSIDRINNDGHYSCGECAQCLTNEWPMNIRWATAKEQSANQTYPRRRINRPAEADRVGR